MARFDMSDAEWSVIQPLLPTKVRGVARRVINGIVWRWRTGCTQREKLFIDEALGEKLLGGTGGDSAARRRFDDVRSQQTSACGAPWDAKIRRWSPVVLTMGWRDHYLCSSWLSPQRPWCL